MAMVMDPRVLATPPVVVVVVVVGSGAGVVAWMA